MQKISTCLWFNNQAEEAMNFYVSTFKNSKVTDVSRFGDAGPGEKGSVMSITINLDGTEIIAVNGGPEFAFTEAMSLFVKCEDQAEIDHYWEKLLDGGKPMRCGWLTDKYGVTWQIVPTVLGELLKDKDREKSKRVMQEMLKMVKLDIGLLQAASKG
ncbi:MAG: VOC family protein [Cyanobacteria bacterium SZAS TMP-1]|nr:VOC family protein [Cyanobacteria bacterium SZAS TMP-1]